MQEIINNDYEKLLKEGKKKRNIKDDIGFIVEDDILIDYIGSNQIIEIPPYITTIKSGSFKHKIIKCMLIHDTVKNIEPNAMNKSVFIIANINSYAIWYAKRHNMDYLLFEKGIDYWLNLKENDIAWNKYKKMVNKARSNSQNNSKVCTIDKKNKIIFYGKNMGKALNKNPDISTLAFDAYDFVIKSAVATPGIKRILLHPKILHISSKAFKQFDKIKLLVFKGSYGEQYAIDCGYEYEYYKFPK